MENLEQKLKRQELAPPSEELDRRMSQLFACALPPRRGILSLPIAAWQCAVACVLVALCGYWLNAGQSQPVAPADTTPAKVYIIQNGPPIPRRAFDATARDRVFLGSPENLTIRVLTETKEAAEANENSV